MKKILALLLTLVLLTSLLPAGASGSGSTYATARTSLADADGAQWNNIERACWSLNQTRVYYGETFSFNEVVGPRTKANGYVSAINGRGAKVAGGGVSQVATTLYLALLDLKVDGITFGKIKTYDEDFTGSYVDDGALAVVTDYKSGHDLSFTNLAFRPLLIEAWISNGYLYCTVATSSSGGSLWGDDVIWGATLLSKATIYCGNNSAVLTNVEQAANSIYDITLSSGDVFSFNDIVGPRTAANGYVKAINGRGVKTMGGGVAQVASALWLAIKDCDDFKVIEKSTYGDRYNQDYVESSADAIVTDYKADRDFSFRYVGSGSITIYTTLNGTVLTCRIVK